jgi:hypothetical protein
LSGVELRALRQLKRDWPNGRHGPGVARVIGELVTASVAQHVGVALPLETRFGTDPFQHPGNGNNNINAEKLRPSRS